MTPQEAIDIIDDVSWEDNGRHYGKIVSARDLAKSALEKQIPKKVHRYDMNPSEKFCPNCGLSIENKGGYCAECGQALDWSDTE